MNVVLIYNAKSGSAYDLRSLRALFKDHGIVIDYSFTVKQLGSKKLAELIRRGSTVAVVGGDGTLNAAARLLVDTESTFMPLPGGTFNHFVRDLGMSPNLVENLQHIAKATTKRIDVGYVNDELFLNNSNIGLYPFSLIERKQAKKFMGKYAAAALSAFDQLRTFRRHKLTIDGTKVRSPFIFVGNNVYDIKRSLIPQRTSLDKGLLTVMIATSPSRVALIRDIFAVVRGDVSRSNDFDVTTRTSIEIHGSHQSLLVSYDGEVKRLEMPLRYRSAPRALKVLVSRQ